MRFYQKGMSFKEFQRMMQEQPKPKRNNNCGCDCDGCAAKGAGTHCLKAPCTRTRNRRSAAQIAAAGRYPSGRVKVPARPKIAVRKARTVAKKEPKVVVEKADPMRTEWFVEAKRNGFEVLLAAPEGEREAQAMRDNLIGFGWEAVTSTHTVWRNDPRFHPLSTKEVPA